ncbi:MAG: PQQ-binding-like beta-propeller repeat protein [Candidatus Zixiibacteriota bacterium]
MEPAYQVPAGIDSKSYITDTHGPNSMNGQKSLDTSGCAYFDLSDYAGSWYTFTATADEFKWSIRYDVAENHYGTLYEVYFDVREATDVVNGDGSGGCDILVEVWDDAGGMPNTVLWSEVIPAADIPMDVYFYQYLALNGGAGVDVGYGPYHVSFEVQGGDPADYIKFYLNQNEDGTDNGNSYAFYPAYAGGPVWVALGDAFGIPLHLSTIVYACQDYSVCYNKEIVSGGYVLSIPYYGVYTTAGSDINGFGQRFTSETAETLNTLIIWLYNHPSDYYGPTTQLNGVDVMVVADDGAGNPDPTTVLATASIPAGLANVYPNGFGWNGHAFDFSSLNLVFVGPWHVLCQTTGDNPADGRIGFVLNDTDSDPDFIGGSVNWVNPAEGYWELCGVNWTWLNELWGVDAAFDYAPIVCLDEFSACQWQILYNALSVNGVSGPIYYAQKVAGVNINRVQEIWTVQTEPGFWGDPSTTPAIEFYIWADGGGQPGAIIYQTELLPDNYDFPSVYGWVNLVIPDVQVVGDFYVGVSWDNTDPGDNYIPAFDAGTTNVNGGSLYSFDGVAWGDLGAAMGWASSNSIFEVNFCSIPFDEMACDPKPAGYGNWPTLQQNMQRTGHSYMSIGSDANCDLTVNNYYFHPSNGAPNVGPIVYEGFVVMPFYAASSEYQIFDLYDLSTPIATINNGYGYINSVPSIYEVGGVPYLFLAGGQTSRIDCYDFSNPAVPTLVWTLNSTDGYKGLPMLAGDGTSYTNFMMLNDGTDDVLFFSTNKAQIFAVYAATGMPYAGWAANGYVYAIPGFNSVITRGMTNDGVGTLFISNQDAPKGGLTALDAFTGDELWRFSGTSFKGSEVYGVTVSVEGFDAGIAYDNGKIWAVSTCVGDHPVDAVLYEFDAANGTPIMYIANNYMRYAQTPVVDQNNVLFQTYTRWYHPPIDLGSLYAIRKTNGNIAWIKNWGNFTTDDRFYNEMILTCETQAADLLFAFSDNGFLHCMNADDGSELFNRRIDYGSTYGQNVGGGGAIALDTAGVTHILFSTYMGGLIDLTEQAYRPRLQVNKPTITKGVSFGTDANYPVLLEDFLSNTGCADLNIQIDIDEASNGSTPGGFDFTAVGDELANEAERMAVAMNDNKLGMYLLESTVAIDENADLRNVASKAVTNPAALAAPAFVSVDQYIDVVAAGDSYDLSLIVDQNELTRGIQTCYAVITSDDPDYFMNDPVADAGQPDVPEVTINIIGGCLIEKQALHFGESQQWTKNVSNTGRIGNRDDEAVWDPACWDIGGDESSYYAGAHFYATGQYRVAMNSQDWLSSTTPLDGEDAIFASMQADPNYVSDDCVPGLASGVNMGTIAYFQGDSYHTLYGNEVYSTVLDSVQNWDDGAGWDWANVQAFFGPFDDTLTIGIMGNCKTIGVYGDAALNGTLHNLVIKVWNFWERNGNAVTDWYFGTYQDPDISGSGRQRANYYGPASLCWTYTEGGTVANGAVKIPFGCGQEPAINSVHFWGNQSGDGAGFFAYVYWDSLYFYCEHYNGLFDNVAGLSGGDGESHYTLVKHDFEPNGEFLFAEALFQVTGMSNSASANELIPLANMANKFMGWGRGDVNNDNVMDIRDIVYEINFIYNGGPGPWPFQYLGNLNPNVDAVYDLNDIMFMIAYYFESGPCPDGYWKHVSPIWDATYE